MNSTDNQEFLEEETKRNVRAQLELAVEGNRLAELHGYVVQGRDAVVHFVALRRTDPELAELKHMDPVSLLRLFKEVNEETG